MSTLKDGGQLFTFSNRFSVSGMTGTTPAAIAAAAKAAGTTPPSEINNAAPAAGAANPAGGQFNIPYGQQTGLTKYAPMQPVPPTKITQKHFTPLNPTSAAKLATTFLGPADVQTTLTASQTFSAKSRENPVSFHEVKRYLANSNIETGRGCIHANSRQQQHGQVLGEMEGLDWNARFQLHSLFMT